MDAENKRYEVNVLNNQQTDDILLPVHDYDYEFSVNTDTTGFSISRKSNQEVRRKCNSDSIFLTFDFGIR